MSDVRDRIVDAARGWIGTPFSHCGRSRHGIDCVGLIVVAYREAGLQIRDRTNYGWIGRPDELRTAVCEAFSRIDVDNADAGDIFTMRIGDLEQHVAIYTGAGTIIHVYASANGMRGAVTEHAITVPWHNRITGCWRHKELG